MSRSSTVPITLDPSVYSARRPQAHSPRDLIERRRTRSITLAPSAFDRSGRSKALPPLPKSPWPLAPGQGEGKDDMQWRQQRRPHRDVHEQQGLGRAYPEATSRQGGIYTHRETEGWAPSNPWSPQGTVHASSSRRQVLTEGPSPPQGSSTRTTRTPLTPFPKSKLTNTPASRSSTLVDEPLPSFSPHTRTTSCQTRYMNMLLSLDKIPRLHNILASLFGWILLAGFVVAPATFTSRAEPPDSGTIQDNARASGVLGTFASLPLLIVAAACCAIGYVGSMWLSLRWRKNYVWLINRLYMPGALNGLAGLISTLTSVYSQHRGSWSVTARAALVVESATLVLCLVLFVVYNNLLLRRVKEQHALGVSSTFDGKTLRGRVERLAKQPAVAPGSIV